MSINHYIVPNQDGEFGWMINRAYMGLRRYMPKFVKPLVRSLRIRGMNLLHPQDRRELIHQYWRDPDDGENQPEYYLNLTNPRRTGFLLDTIKELATPNDTILDIGCNVGRDLHELYVAGYVRTTGIDINRNAILLGRAIYRPLANQLYASAVEDAIKQYQDEQFDIVYTLATLQHIHHQSRWIFRQMMRVAKKYIITLEDERTHSSRNFPRQYEYIFNKQPWYPLREATPINSIEMNGTLMARIFQRGKH